MPVTGSQQPDNLLQHLIDLVSNTLDAYTTALFLAPAKGEPMVLEAFQSLSRNIDESVRIGPGEGLIGWAYKNNESVNVDQFESDTRRLLFYRTDESIKSFMAVPLPGVHGVLAVDSKQKYVFTDKSQKILWQFGRCLEQALANMVLAGRAAQHQDTTAFMSELGEVLTRRGPAGGALNNVLGVIRAFMGASACFCVALMPEDPSRFNIVAQDGDEAAHIEPVGFKLSSGLAGWILQNKKPLHLHRAMVTERSYVFLPDEPLKKFPAVSGYPLVFDHHLLGALILLGKKGLAQDAARSDGLRMAVHRLSLRLEMELLFRQAAEFGRLDPQVGLPHRTHFAERLNRMLQMASVRGDGTTLVLVELANLDDVALEYGQETASEALRSAARFLSSRCEKDAELGLLSYGLLGLGLPGRTPREIRDSTERLLTELVHRPLETEQGHMKLEVQSALLEYPSHGRTAEELIRRGLEILLQHKTMDGA